MLFNSYIFIFLFLPVVLGVYLLVRRLPRRIWAIGWIALASIVYYAYWKPEFLLLLFGSIVVNFAFVKALMMNRLPQRWSKMVLALGVGFNLCLLGYFKYAGFFVQNLNDSFGAGLTVPQIVLPIGISFITFQKIALLVDVYRSRVRDISLLNYVFFVTFFPQLIAGPIVHHSEIMPQLAKTAPPRDVRADLAIGFSIFIVGLFKKVVVADTFAVYADAGFATLKAGMPLDSASAWIAAISYSLQIYFDFSGYSDMAVGLARMFGFQLPINFFSPYKARGIVDFWRRWHITLSRFLRDYLYIPLGGNRRGPIRQYLNLAVVMLLGGLWHGANWTFVLWGGIHGVLLMLDHAWGRLPFNRLPVTRRLPVRMVSIGGTFLLVTLAWVPFRAETMGQAQAMFTSLFPSWTAARASFGHFWVAQAGMLTPSSVGQWFKARELWPAILPPDYLATNVSPVGLVLLAGLAAIFLLPNTYQIFRPYEPALGLDQHEAGRWGGARCLDWWWATVLGGMFVLAVMRLSRVSPFLYFQF